MVVKRCIQFFLPGLFYFIIMKQKVLFPNELYEFLYARRYLDVVLILKPGKKGSNVEMDENNFIKHLTLELLESIINVTIDNTTHSCVIEDGDQIKVMCEMRTMLKHLQEEVRSIKTIVEASASTQTQEPVRIQQ